jgi:putative hemolysin
VLVVTACQPAGSGGESGPSNDVLEEVAEPIADMANPAAVYCEGIGYKTEPRETADGMDAACVFPDGSECGQWDFLSGRCGQEFTHCLQQGGVRLEVAANIGTCIFQDGSACDEYMFFQGECASGDHPSEINEASIEDKTDPGELGIPVVGWMGYVQSTPDGAQYDDFVVFLPEGEVGEFGVEGINDEVNALIVALRDQDQPGKYAHFWGTLVCEVLDYGGCQLLVDRLRVDGPGEFFDPDRVEAWEGRIVDLSRQGPGAPQPDDAFIPKGDYPVHYGVDSAVSAESGERDLRDIIIACRENEAEVRIWGDMMCGVPDAGGCHIEVYKVATSDEVYEITPGD